MLSGSCLCGGVRFRITAPLGPLRLCHCTQCRKAQGSAFAANSVVPAAAFELLDGAALLRDYESSPGKHRVFCGRCGAPVYSRRDALPGVLRVRVGLIDTPLGTRPASHAHVASKADWWSIDDDAPRYEGAAPAP